jgi:hypothetical protein
MKLKNIKYSALGVVALAGMAGLTSCDLDAPAVSTLEASTIYCNYALSEAAVMGIHQSFGETNSYRGRFLPYYGLNTDAEWINGMSGTTVVSGDKYDLACYNAAPENGQMNTDNNAYAKFYEGIERANLAIEGIRKYGDISSRPEMAQLLGEALTLRAFVYLDLVKAWGDVPARFEPNTAETVYLPRTDRDVIYKQLLSDLEEAANYCYWPNENSITTTTERVSKAFVKGLRARIALYAGGYSQRNGQMVKSTDPDLSSDKMYAIAKQECEAIINSGTLSLGEFEANFKNLCMDIVTAGKESIFEVPFSDGRGRVLYTFGVKHQEKDQYTGQAQGGVNGPIPTLFYDYDVDDVRRNITCVPYDWSKETQSKQQLRKLSNWCFGKLRYEWMQRKVTSTNDDGINWQAMRYADIYMMAAEAINELEGPSAAAPYLKPILDRAYPSAKAASILAAASTSKEAFFNTIVDERRFEFAGEMLRKADLIRWNMLKTKLDETKANMASLVKREGKYADLPENLYYKTAATSDDVIPEGAEIFDKMIGGETLIIYGLNHGNTDEIGKSLGLDENTTWIRGAYEGEDGKMQESKLSDILINNLYLSDPNSHSLWPIWKTFIDKSNGTLNNDNL